MKNKWVVASGILSLALVHASSQTSVGGGGTGGGGGASGGTSGGATSGGATVSGSTSTSAGQNGGTVNQQNGVQNQQQLPPGLQNRNQLPPGLQNRSQLPPGLQRGQLRTNEVLGRATNSPFFTNRFAGATNRFGSNTNLSPTGNSGTNRVFSTNHFDFRHFDRSRFRDEAITPTDQSLLIRIRQTITTQISIRSSGGANWVPIHISVENGRVRLSGLVTTADQAQQIQSAVSQMPGISGVENGLSTLPQDQAVTENDRVILTQIRQVIPQTPTGSAWVPLTFDVRQGTVAIAGIVPNVQESQRVETVVRQVPGVVQTSNTLIVDNSSGGTTTITPTSTIPQQ